MDSYEKFYTGVWHKVAPSTGCFVVCSMNEATHVVFSETDLKLAGKDGEYFSENRVYPIRKMNESGKYLIIDDKGQVVIGFDLFIPCEYLKVNHRSSNKNKGTEEYTSKVVSLIEYKNKK